MDMDKDAYLGKLRAEVGAGLEIAALVENETVKKTMTGLLNGLQNDWLETLDPAQRELLWQQAQGVKQFWAALRTIVDTGKMAQAQLRMEQNDDEK